VVGAAATNSLTMPLRRLFGAVENFVDNLRPFSPAAKPHSSGAKLHKKPA
jgi:hypothetical protein